MYDPSCFLIVFEALLEVSRSSIKKSNSGLKKIFWNCSNLVPKAKPNSEVLYPESDKKSDVELLIEVNKVLSE